MFRFSHSGKQFSIDQLKENLLQLVPFVGGTQSSSKLTLDEVLQHPKRLVGERINHRFEVDGDLIWYEGTVQRYNSEFLIAYDGEWDLFRRVLVGSIVSRVFICGMYSVCTRYSSTSSLCIVWALNPKNQEL